MCFQAAHAFDQDLEEEEIRAQAFLAELNEEYDHRRNVEQIVGWAYGSNITEENEKHRAEVLAENAKFYKVSGTDSMHWTGIGTMV